LPERVQEPSALHPAQADFDDIFTVTELLSDFCTTPSCSILPELFDLIMEHLQKIKPQN
jgi:hypothetical protein